MSHQPTQPLFQGDKILCPTCNEYVEFLSIQRAANLIRVTRRTIYNYIEAGDIYAAKVAGKTYRVCSKCLLKPDTSRQQNNFKTRK